MAVFNFDEAQVFEERMQTRTTFNFLKLQDDGWQAKIRFMYGPGEIFKGYVVHNISKEERKPKYVECLRGETDPLEACPLCQNNFPINIQYYLPVYVISITKKINGQLQPEEPVNQIMLFQRGKTFNGALQSAIRQAKGTPLCTNVFNLVRNGKNGDPGTTYLLESFSQDNTTLESLGERPVVEGSYILPTTSYDDALKIVNESSMPQQPSGVMPRPVAYTQGQQAYPQPQYAQPQYAQPQYTQPQMPQNNGYQAPTQAPNIPF